MLESIKLMQINDKNHEEDEEGEDDEERGDEYELVWEYINDNIRIIIKLLIIFNDSL